MATTISEPATSNITIILNTVYAPVCDMPHEMAESVGFAFNIVIIPIVSFFGIVGNVLTIVILKYNGLNESTNIILTGLAVGDLFFSVTQFFPVIPRCMNSALAESMFNYYAVYIYGWNQYAVCISIHMVTLIALERMIAVCFPFRVSTLLTPYRIKCIVIAIYFSDAILYIPRDFMREIKWTFFSSSNSTIAIQVSTDFLKSNGFTIYNDGIISTIAIFIPTTTIIVCSIMITTKLTLSYRNIKKLSSSDARSKRVKDVRSVKITLIICLFVIICVLAPTNIFNKILNDRNLFSGYCVFVLISVVFLIYQINASVNFIIYVAMSPKFVKTFRLIFLCAVSILRNN
ncbi:FMRFamide receptor-like [Physella acuta]|uniref:FMRFamide receptor-like n=1 Tax=Physella acuta TaxID=109671 RepID=UPI0027DC450F|nr:FMRFamide receptor-like [Physella acuta]